MRWQDVRGFYQEYDPNPVDVIPRDGRGRPIDCTPIGAKVTWYEPVRVTDDGPDGERYVSTIDAPFTRSFYGPSRVAWRAADRFATLMRQRGKSWVSVDDIG